MNTIANQLKEIRINKGMTQEALAEMSNVSLRTIQRIELGKVNPRKSTLDLLTKILGIKSPAVTETKEVLNKLIKQMQRGEENEDKK